MQELVKQFEEAVAIHFFNIGDCFEPLGEDATLQERMEHAINEFKNTL